MESTDGMAATPEVIAAAEYFLAQGYHIVAVRADKRPWGRDWRRIHSRDEIIKLLEGPNCPAIGFLGGEINGSIVALDFDNFKGEAWFRLNCQILGIDPDGFPTVVTPGKFRKDGTRFPGRHRYMRDLRGSLGNAAGSLALVGIDVRGRGHTMLPPSPHPDGGVYKWVPGKEFADFAAIPLVPDFVYEAIAESPEAAIARAAAAQNPNIVEFPAPPPRANGPDLAPPTETPQTLRSLGDTADPAARFRAYGLAALKGAGDRLAAATEPGRNIALNNEALGLAHYSHLGCYGEGEALSALMTACDKNGLLAADGTKACHATFWSGWKKGLSEPRDLPDRPLGPDRPDYAGGHAEQSQPDPAPDDDLLPIRDAGTWTEPAPPRAWLVSGHYPWGLVGMISGDGGVGKTLLMQQLATCVALGLPWLGFATLHCKVLAVFCEDDEDDVHRRQDDINRHYGIAPADLLDRLHYACRASEDNVLIEFDQSTNSPRHQPLFEALKRKIIAFGPGLVLLDTLADIYGGSENVRIQVRRFISALRKVAKENDTTIVLTAHPSLTGMATGSGTSGSTHWNNGIRARSYLTRPTVDDEVNLKSPRRTLKTMKSNWGATGDEVPLLWTNGVFINANSDPILAKAGTAQAEAYFLDCLDKINAQDRYVTTNVTGNYAPRIFAKQPDNPGCRITELDAAMQSLFHQGKIRLAEFRDRRRHRIERIERTPDDTSNS
jgi:archaellum biogenesis ATPase FlaH